MSDNSTNSLCSRCERFDIQAFGKSSYPYRRLSLSAAMQSAERGCPFCSMLTESLATSHLLNRSWLSLIFSALYIELQVEKDHHTTSIESGGLGIYKITASVVKNSVAGWNDRLPQTRLEVNVSADEGKTYAIKVVLYGQPSLIRTSFSLRYTSMYFQGHRGCAGDT